jgi:hypothetical protein
MSISAAAELELRRRLADIDARPLVEYVRYINPTYEAPHHLQPIADELERAFHEPVECCFSAMPQCGKSELIWSAMAKFIARNPTKRNAYISYSATIAERKSRTILEYAKRARANLDPLAQAGGYWKTREGGSVIAAGIGGPLTGEGFDGWVVIDDPHKNRQEAESAVRRSSVHDWYASIGGRIHPGASVFINHHRWHEDDMIGRLVANEDAPFKWVNLPAINEKGEALWPSKRPLDWLKKRRAQSEYDWESLFMGNPRPKGAKVFRDVQLYDELPTGGYRVAIGADCAYSESKKADYSVGLALAAYDVRDSKGRVVDTQFFVLLVHRLQVESPAFAKVLDGMATAWPGAPLWWYTSGTELGVAQHLRKEGATQLRAIPATADKFIRAQPVAAAWNRGKIFVPRDAPWVAEFINEVLGFTGAKDVHDDQVDALAAAYDALVAGGGMRIDARVSGARKMRSLGGY